MFTFFKILKISTIFFLIPTFWVVIFSSKVLALIAPQVYFTEINLVKNNFEPGEKIEGTVSLWNYEEFVVSDLRFHFQLLAKEINGVPTQMIDEKIGGEIFSLLPGEKVTKSFTYSLPSNLPKGNFKFRIQLANTKGEEMGWIDKVISIGGEGKFLILENYWIVKNGQNLHPGAGVDYQPGEIPQVRFDAINDTAFTIVAFPKIITYKRNVGGEIVKIQEEKSIVFGPGQKQTLKFNLPQLEKPESYLSEIRLYDSQTKEPISNSIYFRWVISGEDDAEVLFVNPDKDSYSAGEEAKIQIQYTGPAHFEMEGDKGMIIVAHSEMGKGSEMEGGKGVIIVKLFNQEGKLVGEGKKEIELRPAQIIVNVPVKENVDNPKIVTQIVKGDKILDEYEFQVQTKHPREKKEIEKISFWKKIKNELIVWVLSIIIIIGLIVFFLKMKKMKRIKTLGLLILLGKVILFGNYVLAATQVTGGCCDTTIIINSPQPNQEYKVGDTITFSGAFKVTNCNSGLFFNKFTFYITEDKDIPITDCCGRKRDSVTLCNIYIDDYSISPPHPQCVESCNEECKWIKVLGCGCCEDAAPRCGNCDGCRNCYGAKSSYLSDCRFMMVSWVCGTSPPPSFVCKFRWCDRVKYLDTTTSPYKIYKLGEIYPSDVPGGSKSYWVEYNQSFTIPSNLEFSGPVRFYVQYSGTHGSDHWHWNITYQKGTIYSNFPPTVSELETIRNRCAWGTIPQVALGLAITLKWKYSDKDEDSQSAYEIWLDEDQSRLAKNPRFKFSTQSVSNSYTLNLSDNQSTVKDAYRYPLNWNKTYYWKVRVKDSQGNWSDWSTVNSFTTPKHASPYVDFSWKPERPSVNEIVQFTDLSECYDANNNIVSCKNWFWTFQDGNPPNSTNQNATTTFTSPGSKTVTSTVEDYDGYKCTTSKTVQSSFPLPKWKEIPPFIWIKKFLASIIDLFDGILRGY